MDEQREDRKPEKWRGQARAELKGPESNQIWSLLSDFCSVDKWLPHVDVCYRVEGVDGEAGLIRYCSSTQSSDDEEVVIKWVKERLITLDATEKWFSYEIVENNAGFGSYVATIKLLDAGEDGYVIQWSYEADPVVGWTPEDLLSFLQLTVHAMARRMEEALLQPCNS